MSIHPVGSRVPRAKKAFSNGRCDQSEAFLQKPKDPVRSGILLISFSQSYSKLHIKRGTMDTKELLARVKADNVKFI